MVVGRGAAQYKHKETYLDRDLLVSFRKPSANVNPFGVVLALDIKANIPLRLLGILDQVIKSSLHLEKSMTLGKVTD